MKIGEIAQLFWVYTSLCDEVWSDPGTPLDQLEIHLCSLLNAEVLRRKLAQFSDNGTTDDTSVDLLASLYDASKVLKVASKHQRQVKRLIREVKSLS